MITVNCFLTSQFLERIIIFLAPRLKNTTSDLWFLLLYLIIHQIFQNFLENILSIYYTETYFHFLAFELLQKVLLPKALISLSTNSLFMTLPHWLPKYSITVIMLGPYWRTYNGSLLFSKLSFKIRNLGCTQA